MKLRSVIVLIVVLAVLMAACGRSEFSYIEQQEEGVFLKVPDHWAVFESTEYEPEARIAADILLQPLVPPPSAWQVIIDGGPVPTASNLGVHLYGFPIGIAEIQPIEGDLQDLFNTVLMRSLAVGGGFDPIDPPEGSNITVELDRDVVLNNLRGNRVRFRVPREEGTAEMFDSLVLADGQNTRWYRVTIGCEERCFQANAALIDEIITSFTVDN